jgi:hypothetical protein
VRAQQLPTHRFLTIRKGTRPAQTFRGKAARCADAPSPPHPLMPVVQSTRYLFVLPGHLRYALSPHLFRVTSHCLRLTGDGQIGQMDKMDGKNPTLSMPLPDGSTLVRSASAFSSLFRLCQLAICFQPRARRSSAAPSSTPRRHSPCSSSPRKAAAQ